MINERLPRNIGAHLAATTRDRDGRLPDVFDGSQYLVADINQVLTDAREATFKLGLERLGRSLIGMQRAQAELDRLLRQCWIMNSSLERVLRFHARARQNEQQS